MGSTAQDRKRVAERREEVEDMLSVQFTSQAIQKAMSEKYGVTTRTVRTDIKKVVDRWEEEAAGERRGRRNQMRETLRRILRKALATKDYKAAISAADRMMQLDGLKAPVKVEAETVHTTRIELMSSDQQRKRLFELAAGVGIELPAGLDRPGPVRQLAAANGGSNGHAH